MDAVTHLIVAAFRNTIDEANVEAGFERVQEVVGNALDYASFHDAVAICLRDGLIREPVRLEEGALQCHWRLELTLKGVATARSLIGW